jgi:hypothetical protein
MNSISREENLQQLLDLTKHLVLIRKKHANPSTHIWTNTLGMAPFGMLPFGCGQKWEVYFPSDRNADANTRYRPVEIESLARRVLEKWDAFL